MLRRATNATTSVIKRGMLHAKVAKRLNSLKNDEASFRTSHEMILDFHKEKMDEKKAKLILELDEIYSKNVRTVKQSNESETNRSEIHTTGESDKDSEIVEVQKPRQLFPNVQQVRTRNRIL